MFPLTCCFVFFCEVLIDQGADIDASTTRGSTALMYAAFHGRIDVLRALIFSGNRGQRHKLPNKLTGKENFSNILVDLVNVLHSANLVSLSFIPYSVKLERLYTDESLGIFRMYTRQLTINYQSH